MARKVKRSQLRLEDVYEELRGEFGERGLAAGVTLAREGHIALEAARLVEGDSWRLQGRVRGDDDKLHRPVVEIELSTEDALVLSAECNCETQLNCKHAAGLTWLWLQDYPVDSDGSLTDERPEEFGELDQSDDALDIPFTPPAPVTQTTGVSDAIKAWLQRGYAQQDEVNTTAAVEIARTDGLAYLITTEGRLTVARYKANRKTGVLSLTGQAPSLSWVHNQAARPAYVSDADEPILRLIAGVLGPYRAEPTLELSGGMGESILQMALATQRLWPAPMAFSPGARAAAQRLGDGDAALSKPFTTGTPVNGVLRWQRSAASGKAVPLWRLTIGTANAATDGADSLDQPVLALQPPRWVDLKRSIIQPLVLDISSASLTHLLNLPPLADNDSAAWHFVRNAIGELPERALVPPLPVALPADGLSEPLPILRFALFEFDYSDGWGYAKRTHSLAFPGVQLLFRYPNRAQELPYDPRGFDTAVEQTRVGKQMVSQHLRNVRAEQRAHLRLPKLLQPAIRVEPKLSMATAPHFPHASIYALANHDWSQQGAVVLADAQMAGFHLDIHDGFPITLEDIPEPSLELSPSAERGWFRLTLGVSVNGERIDLAPHFARLIAAQNDPMQWLDKMANEPSLLLSAASADNPKRSVVVRLSGARVHALLAPVFDWFLGGGVPQVSELQAALSPNLPNDTVQYLGRNNPAWTALRDKLRDGETLQPVSPADGFDATLRPYQLNGLAWLAHLQTLNMGGVLADDMGLGKTVQTLAHLHREYRSAGGKSKRPSLIVAPTSVVSNWYNEAKRFAPDLLLHRHHGIDRSEDRRDLTRAHVVITSYPVLQRDEQLLSGIDWHCIVFDEAQTLKNPKAKTYQAAQLLRAQMRLGLTGTPMENHLGDLWSLYNLLLPGLLGDLDSFNRIFRHPIEQRAVVEQLQKLKTRIRPFILRRTRDLVLSELPPKTEYTRWIDLDGAQADLYESLRTAIHDDVRRVIDKKGLKQSTIHILDALLKLRQVCCDPRLLKLPGDRVQALAQAAQSAKLDWLREHVPELLEEGRRILIFSQFTSMLALISEMLNAQQIGHVVLTGDTVNRDEPIARFQSGEVPVFLLSLKAGGVGLNLTEADTVIHYDPWWNPAVEAQATARAHRMGQQKPVFVTKLVARGTLEERMLGMLERKRELAGALLEGEGNALTGLSEADVEHLLAPISSLQ